MNFVSLLLTDIVLGIIHLLNGRFCFFETLTTLIEAYQYWVIQFQMSTIWIGNRYFKKILNICYKPQISEKQIYELPSMIRIQSSAYSCTKRKMVPFKNGTFHYQIRTWPGRGIVLILISNRWETRITWQTFLRVAFQNFQIIYVISFMNLDIIFFPF